MFCFPKRVFCFLHFFVSLEPRFDKQTHQEERADDVHSLDTFCRFLHLFHSIFSTAFRQSPLHALLYSLQMLPASVAATKSLPNHISQSPVTQDSSSMSSFTDEYDFKNNDISSSAQTSTASPIRQQHVGNQPKLNSFSFYSGPPINARNNNHVNDDIHAFSFRKSLIISPSFNSISSTHQQHDIVHNVEEEGQIDDFDFGFNDSQIVSTLTDPKEEPTKQMGMVISPSIRALSDILTNKVTTKATSLQTPILEENEDGDNATILLNQSRPTQSSLIDDFYSPKSNTKSSTFHKTNSNDTLTLNNSQKDQPQHQHDLIDLTSPVESNNNFQSLNPSVDNNLNVNPNYSDIYESYSPSKEDNDTKPIAKSPFVNKTANRFSMMSDNVNFNDFQSPALNFDEPIETFNFIAPSASFSKLSIDDSFREIGYNSDEENDFESDDADFSFVPSRKDTLSSTSQKVNSSTTSFVQKHQNRNSIRIVEDEDDKSPFINEFLKSPKAYPSNNSTPIVNNFTFDQDVDLTPKVNQNIADIDSTPKLNSDTIPVLPSSPPKTPTLLNKSPIRNTSPTFENLKNSPTQQIKKKFINLSPPRSPKKELANPSKPLKPSKPSKAEKPMVPAKPKTKLTFKSFFSKSTDNLSSIITEKNYEPPTLTQTDKSNRPKSFSFNNLNGSKQQQEMKDSRKEKSKSLLSGWKRRSLAFNNNNNNNNNKTFHSKSQSAASLPIFANEKSSNKQTPPSPHKHSKSTPELFDKKLPNLPPPSQSQSQSLLRSYGFDQTSPSMKQTPIIPKSPDFKPSAISNESPTWERVPTIKKSESVQTIKTAESPTDLLLPQSAQIDQTTPQILESGTFDDNNHDTIVKPQQIDHSDYDKQQQNSSSVYDTTNDHSTGNIENELSFFKPPLALGISKPPVSPLGLSNSNNLLKTPPSATSPPFSVVDSFISSPNKYRIGDDMFPNKLNRNDIESIISLERSRSMRSIKSIKSNNSILKMIHDKHDDFDEIVTDDGMIVVKSPMLDQNSLWNKPSRTPSILKHSIKAPDLSTNYIDTKLDDDMPENNEDVTVNKPHDTADDDFNEFIDLINFDDDGDDLFDTNFDIDTTLKVKLSPVRNTIVRDSSVPDFLGIETSYGSMNFNDDLSLVEQSPTNQKYNMYENNNQSESIENIIKNEEILHNDLNISTQSLHDNFQYNPPSLRVGLSPVNHSNESFQGLKGPSFNSNLKPETKSAILDSLTKNQTILPSDSENSISYIAKEEQTHLLNNKVNQFNDHDDYDDDYNTYENYYRDDANLPIQSSPSNSKYSLNNPFTDYTQSYDEDNDADYIDTVQMPVSDQENKRKSFSFMNKLTTKNEHGHLSTSSLPTQTTVKYEEKSKTLNRRKNRTSVSFGSMFDSIIPQQKEVSKPSVRFSSRILLYDTYNEDDYDRKPASATCNSLTPQIAMDIKNELNQVKSEMPVHEDSRCYTQFF